MNNYCLNCLGPCGCYDYCFRCSELFYLARPDDVSGEQASEAR